MAPLRCANSALTARLFVQLAKRRYATITSGQFNAPLDFLVPRGASTSPASRSLDASPRSLFSTSHMRTQNPCDSRIRKLPLSRGFSTSLTRLATTCIHNPQIDDDGNTVMLEITPRAAKRLSEIMVKDKNPDLALRIQVESGGCHGFQYLMSLITIPQNEALESSSSPIINEDDSIFQYVPDDVDALPSMSQTEPKIILDEASLDLLKGSKVDYTIELIGSQFKIVDNPYAVSSCGCGTSFDIKM